MLHNGLRLGTCPKAVSLARSFTRKGDFTAAGKPVLLIAAQRLIHRAIVTGSVAGLPLVGLANTPRSRQ